MNLLLVSQVLIESKARSTALASAVKIEESSGKRCILILLSLPLTHQYKLYDNSYNDIAGF